ncbi:MAG: winged helix-turn-helix transcriptional regulator [bacterium]|nr:winged helix-turn-helix transcriptional regulator [bacterium]
MDSLDRKILAELSEKARQPHSQLAKRIKISREVFDYRVKKLKEAGIIKGYEARINIKNFTYGGYILLIQAINLNEEREKEVISILKKNPAVYYIEKCGGSYDFVLGVNVRSLTDFSHAIDKINDAFGKNKVNMTILTMIKELRDSFKPLFMDKSEFNNVITGFDLPQKVAIDNIDKKLILRLGKDASITSPNLVKELGITEVAIRKRIKRLLDKKVILGFRTMIDLGKLSLQVSSLLIKINVQSSDAEKQLQAFFQFDKNNTYICKVIGEYNYFVTIYNKDNVELKDYIKNLRNKFPELIMRVDILPLFELNYHTHVPFEIYK